MTASEANRHSSVLNNTVISMGSCKSRNTAWAQKSVCFSPHVYTVTRVLLAIAILRLLAFPVLSHGEAKNLQAAKSPGMVTRVPFVGCKSDGQAGPKKPPKGKSKAVYVAADAAQRLSYYKAEDGPGILAPRGWYCFGTYGSNGQSLYVTSQPINPADLFAPGWKGFTGMAIQISYEYGDTSGRFEVARMIARVFPAHKAFATTVIGEGIEPADSFPSGPYPQDTLVYRSDELVEYQTPAQTEGLGTRSSLRKNEYPICGSAMLVGDTPDLQFVAIRLSPALNGLAPAIIQQVERDTVDIAQGDIDVGAVR
jgi:hypothetical protein